MSQQQNSRKWVVEEKIDKEELRHLASELQKQIAINSPKSKDVENFSKYPPLISAIDRAKNMCIEAAEELPGMHYWDFETEVGSLRFKPLGEVLAKFEFALKCWKLEG